MKKLLSMIRPGRGGRVREIKIKHKKMGKMAGTPLDTTLLVFLALCLAAGTLLIFYLNSGYVSSKISDSRFLEETYVKETKIDFYVDDIVEKSIYRINDKNNPVPEFLINFKNELNKYKTNNTYVLSELSQLENIGSENVNFIDGKIVVNININLKQDYNGKFLVNYNCNRRFEKIIN